SQSSALRGWVAPPSGIPPARAGLRGRAAPEAARSPLVPTWCDHPASASSDRNEHWELPALPRMARPGLAQAALAPAGAPGKPLLGAEEPPGKVQVGLGPAPQRPGGPLQPSTSALQVSPRPFTIFANAV